MAILRRDDGITFVLQPYRETLTTKTSSLLRRETRYLAEEHGAYVRLFKLASGEYEAVFAQEAGFLLGEMVWQHFGKPDNMIYCELLESSYANKNDGPQALLVVARDGKVFLDAKFSLTLLADELAGLFAGDAKDYAGYEIYDYLPGGAQIFNFDEFSIKSRTALKTPIFSELAVHTDQFKLLPLEAALDEQHLGTRKKSSLIAVSVICIAVLVGLWWWYVEQRPPAQPVQQINPYEQYELALQTPAPDAQVNALLDGIKKIRGIAGWQPLSFAYQNQAVSVPMRSLGGTATALMMAAQQLNMAIVFSSQGAQINFSVVLPERPAPDHISESQQVVALVIDRMMLILPGKSVQIANTTRNQVFSQTNMTISFEHVSPSVLQLMGANLRDLPVSLISCNATIENGLLSGSIELSVVGK